MSWIPFALVGGALVFKDDIKRIISGDSEGGNQRGPLCPACASKKAGRASVWRDKCVGCNGACAVLPDNKQAIDSVMQQIYGGAKTNQPPLFHDIADDPSQGPINLAETEGARPSIRQQMMGGEPASMQYTQGPSMQQGEDMNMNMAPEQQQMQGGFGAEQGTIGGVPAPSTRPAQEGDTFPGASYPGPI